jgi:hypothetical protein
MERETLATYPLVSVRIACRNCRRRGSYRLARLAERYGADTTLEELLIKVTADCNLASNRTGRPGVPRRLLPGSRLPAAAARSPARAVAH